MRTAITLLLLSVITACRTSKPQTAEVRTEVQTHTRYIERLVTDTVLLSIPAQTASNITPTDSSWLETDYAASGAWVDTLGLLHHTLYNKTQQQPVVVQRPEVYADSVRLVYRYIRQRVEVNKPYPKIVKFALKAVPVLLSIILMLTAWIFRRPLIKLCGRILCR